MKQKKPSRNTAIPRVFSSVECARRTGLTVRALRVYERAGLITQQRGANGWRVYGEREVRCLNYIITLKTLGLTLREIRDVLSTAAPPPLFGVLQLQLKSWLARQAAAEQALKLVRAALARLAADRCLGGRLLLAAWRRSRTRPLDPQRAVVSGRFRAILRGGASTATRRVLHMIETYRTVDAKTGPTIVGKT